MRYFFDTEFIEDGHTIDLISIGIVAEDGREYYAISTEFDESKASNWVKENVIAQLEPRNQNNATFWKPRSRIKEDVLQFVKQPWLADLQNTEYDSLYQLVPSEKIVFWAYYADYDWVTLCQLFGTMMDLPKGFPFYCRDIKQMCDEMGNPKLPEQGKGEHNALADARWNKQAWEFLRNLDEDVSFDRPA
jgi:hypothetical protein